MTCYVRRMYLCDSFMGLPKPRDSSLRKDENIYVTAKHNDTFAVTEQQVIRNFAAFGFADVFLENGAAKLIKGYFVHSLPPLRAALVGSNERLAILRMDGDMYDSTVDILYNLYDLVSVGGYIVVDDFGWDDMSDDV